MTRVIVIPEDDDVDPERIAKMSTHDHNYLPANEIEEEMPAFKKRKIAGKNHNGPENFKKSSPKKTHEIK